MPHLRKRTALQWARDPHVEGGPDAVHQLTAELQRWLGTPYAQGQSRRGVACHCWGFVGGVLDALYRLSGPLPAVPFNTGLDDRRAAVAVVGMLCRRYPHVVARDGLLYPGDVLVARRVAGPGHVYIAGSGQLWHADRATGVTRTALAASLNVMRVYRLQDKHLWQ